MTEFPAVECAQLSKRFGEVEAVRSLSFTLDAGQFMALLGPSGCGKTTALRLIAGLEVPDSGTITINGRTVTGPAGLVPPNRRRVGMVFQDYALFPHMTIEQNIRYGLAQQAGRNERVREMLALVGLTGVEQRYPHELSGGQQQRIALARALAPQPDILLLDEPFSNLDVALRKQVREDVQRIVQDAGVTTILVTHDQDEAMSLADRIALMFDGSIVQLGTPRNLYEQPVSRRAAQFLGEANVLSGQAEGTTAHTALGPVALAEAQQGAVEIVVRPEHLTLDGAAEGIPATVTRRMYYGTHQDIWVALDDATRLKVRCPANTSWREGDSTFVHVAGPVAAFPSKASLD